MSRHSKSRHGRSRAKRAYTVDDLGEMDDLTREFMRATKEHVASILWAASAICGLLLVGSLSLAQIEFFSAFSIPVLSVLGAATLILFLLAFPYLHQIRKIDNRELEGAEKFFADLKVGGTL